MSKLQSLSSSVLIEARIPKRHWKGFDSSTYYGRARSLDLVKRYIDKQAFAQGFGLLFTGGSASGKTHMMCNVLITLLHKGANVLYASFSDLVDCCFETDSKRELWNMAKDVYILGIDNVEALSFPNHKQFLERLLKHRVDSSLPTFIATSLFASGDFEKQYGAKCLALATQESYRIECSLSIERLKNDKQRVKDTLLDLEDEYERTL